MLVLDEVDTDGKFWQLIYYDVSSHKIDHWPRFNWICLFMKVWTNYPKASNNT